MTHQLILYEPWFGFVLNGSKKLEARRGTLEQFAHINKIEFTKGKKDQTMITTRSQTFVLDVKCMRHYKDLTDMLDCEFLQDLLPSISNKEEALTIYHQFWSDQLIQESGGIIVFELF